MIDCGCVSLKRKNPCVTILSRPLHNNDWLWLCFLKEEKPVRYCSVHCTIFNCDLTFRKRKTPYVALPFPMLKIRIYYDWLFTKRQKPRKEVGPPYVIISYRMLQGRKDQWTVLLYSLIRCKIMNYCECLFWLYFCIESKIMIDSSF